MINFNCKKTTFGNDQKYKRNAIISENDHISLLTTEGRACLLQQHTAITK